MWKKLFDDPSINIPFKKFAQFQVNNPSGQPYKMDFAIPDLKIDIEADGKIFHEGPEKKARDHKRDTVLANRGWIVLRFTEREIENQIDSVVQSIMSYVNQRVSAMKNNGKKRANVSSRIKHSIRKINGE